MAKLKTYTVSARLNIVVDLEIRAASLVEAATEAQNLKVKDFVDIYGSWIDGDAYVDGVYESA